MKKITRKQYNLIFPKETDHLSQAQRVAMLGPAERKLILKSFDLDKLQSDWNFWARPAQQYPMSTWLYWLVCAGRGFGKALDIRTPVPTPIGWSTMGDIKDGDKVLDEQGNICTVIKAHDVMHDRECYEITFSDGAKITADKEHLWTTVDRRTRKAMGRRTGVPSKRQQCQPKHFPKTLTTYEIMQTLTDNREINHSIECVKPLQLPEQELLLDPYLFGCWLGDGHSKAAAITTEDIEIIQAFRDAGYITNEYKNNNCGNAKTYGIKLQNGVVRCKKTGRLTSDGDGFFARLNKLNVIKNKHIPMDYKRASEAQRLALLQGLFDTDGSCNKQTGGSEYCTISKILAYDVLELSLSMGIKAVLYTGRAMLNGKDCGIKYRICFTAHKHIPIFRLERKLKLLPKYGKQAKRAYRRYIKNVQPMESVPVRCLTVDSPSKLFLVGKEMIPTHNTRVGAETVREWGRNGSERIALIGATTKDTRDIMVEGESGLLAVCADGEIKEYSSSKGKILFNSGALASSYSAEKADRLRGPQHSKGWCDELCAWKRTETWDMYLFGLRLGKDLRTVITTTPQPIPILKDIMKDPETHLTTGSSFDNAGNLAPKFISTIKKKYEGTRLGDQELYAKILDDVPGALWTGDMLYACRVPKAPHLVKIVVAVDPATTATMDSDETGIIVAGLGDNGHAYVLADQSCKLSPNGWGQRVCNLYTEYLCDVVVAEVNQGGDMVETIIRNIDNNISYKSVHAKRGKFIRAQPVAMLYEQGKVHHVCKWDDAPGSADADPIVRAAYNNNPFDTMEEQLKTYNPLDFDGSPDRLDALVYSITELLLVDDDGAGLRRL